MPRMPSATPAGTAEASTLGSMTLLLHAWKRGDPSAFARLADALQGEFQRMAASRLRGFESATLSRGDLVNEAMLRLMQSQAEWKDRAHFFATVSLHMRSVLREHARARMTDKRGGGRVQLTLTSAALGEESMAADLLTLDALLDQLAAHDARCARVIELTYITGLERADVAEVLGISPTTVDRELRFGRAWLSGQLGRSLEA
jgi:RNA polymerase sigma factor (TIGR02999 family)